MSLSIWQADNTQPTHEVDVLIVGAGLIGCSAAYFASQAGRTVTIVDQRNIAMGASGRNAGFLITGLDNYYHQAVEKYGEAVTQEMWQLSRKTVEFVKKMALSHGVPLQQSGSLLLAETAAEAQDLHIAADALRAADIDITFYDHDPLGRGYYAAIEQTSDAAVQPYHLTHAIYHASGATLIANNEVYRIEQTADQYATVYTQQAIFKARHVLLATNAYSPQLDSYFQEKIIPTRAQVLVTEPLDHAVIDHCGYSNYGYMYYRMTFDQRFLIGGARHKHVQLEHDTTEDRVNPLVQAELIHYLATYFPDVNRAIARQWSGIMGFSIDGLPMVGTLPQCPRIGFAVGFTGHGLTLGAGVAQRAVERLLHGTSAGAVDVQRFDS